MVAGTDLREAVRPEAALLEAPSTPQPRSLMEMLGLRARMAMEDMRELELQVEKVETRGCNSGMATILLQQVGENKKRWMELLEAADRMITNCPAGEQEQLEEDRDYLVTNIRGGLRTMGTRIQDSVRAERTHSHQKSFLKCLEIGQFNGRVEHWVEFQQTFQQLTADQEMPDAVLLAHLRRCLTPCPEALDLITGITDPKEAWKELEGRYGDSELALVIVKHQLLSHSVGKGPDHTQVESLRNAVRKARAQLKGLGAVSLFSDTTVVSQLVHKLPPMIQWDWHVLATSPTYLKDTRGKEEKFVEWLEKMGQAAKSARRMEVAASLMASQASCPRAHPSTVPTSLPVPVPTSLPVPVPTSLPVPVPVPQPLDNGLMAEAAHPGGDYEEALQTEAGARMARQLWQERLGACPLCRLRHTYLRQFKWGSLEWPSQRLEGCAVFQAMLPAERGQALGDLAGCTVCTAWTHTRTRCRNGYLPDCREVSRGRTCGGRHHKLLHTTAVHLESTTDLGQPGPPPGPGQPSPPGKVDSAPTAGRMRADYVNPVSGTVSSPSAQHGGKLTCPESTVPAESAYILSAAEESPPEATPTRPASTTEEEATSQCSQPRPALWVRDLQGGELGEETEAEDGEYVPPATSSDSSPDSDEYSDGEDSIKPDEVTALLADAEVPISKLAARPEAPATVKSSAASVPAATEPVPLARAGMKCDFSSDSEPVYGDTLRSRLQRLRSESEGSEGGPAEPEEVNRPMAGCMMVSAATLAAEAARYQDATDVQKVDYLDYEEEHQAHGPMLELQAVRGPIKAATSCWKDEQKAAQRGSAAASLHFPWLYSYFVLGCCLLAQALALPTYPKMDDTVPGHAARQRLAIKDGLALLLLCAWAATAPDRGACRPDLDSGPRGAAAGQALAYLGGNSLVAWRPGLPAASARMGEYKCLAGPEDGPAA
jgi:hypothetical protein